MPPLRKGSTFRYLLIETLSSRGRSSIWRVSLLSRQIGEEAGGAALAAVAGVGGCRSVGGLK